MGSLAQTGMLSRQQVMLPTHHLTIRVNYRLFSTLDFPFPNYPRESLIYHIFLYQPNAERVTRNRAVVNAIYSGAKGAQLVSVSSLGGDVWIVDCEAEINVTFKIGGQSYPIHPLDVTRQQVEGNGESFCYGTVRVASPRSFVC